MKLIPLSLGLFAKVDDEDFEELSRVSWSAQPSRNKHGGFYARRMVRVPGRKLTIHYMHRHILKLVRGDKIQVDHKNNDSLDNRRCNLRLATSAQNNANRISRGKLKGTYFRNGKWVARIQIDHKQMFLGRFETESEAAAVYDKAAYSHYGEFARLNIPHLVKS